MSDFRALLDARQASSSTRLGPADTWAHVEAALSEEPAFKACPPAARVAVWEEVLQGLLAAEREAWAAEDRATFRTERKRALFPLLFAVLCTTCVRVSCIALPAVVAVVLLHPVRACTERKWGCVPSLLMAQQRTAWEVCLRLLQNCILS
jgi:hypothetical protein